MPLDLNKWSFFSKNEGIKKVSLFILAKLYLVLLRSNSLRVILRIDRFIYWS